MKQEVTQRLALALAVEKIALEATIALQAESTVNHLKSFSYLVVAVNENL